MPSYEGLRQFSEQVFREMGHNPANAELASKVLVSADLRGVDSHGVARLSGFVRLWDAKRLNPTPEIEITHETPSTATVDGDSGVGLVVGPKAMKIAMAKAKEAGTGWVAACNSNHFGIAAYHTMLALEEDMIGIAMTNASPLVAPTFSSERLLGTNPISVAVPSGKEDPFVADFATTTAANGKLELLQRTNQKTPSGWVQEADGEPSNDPTVLKSGGALLPLGGDREHGSHKGFILGSIVDILSGVLSGANYGPWCPPFVSFLPVSENPVGKGIGHFFGAMRIDAFRPAEDFKQNMDIWLSRFKTAKTTPEEDRVFIPGEIEREFEMNRKDKGIELNDLVVKDLEELAMRFGLAMPS